MEVLENKLGRGASERLSRLLADATMRVVHPGVWHESVRSAQVDVEWSRAYDTAVDLFDESGRAILSVR